jgi:type IV pilus assembly protein PilA
MDDDMIKKRKGFTLIELLVVVAIIGILAALFVPMIAAAMQKAKQKGTMQDMNTLAKAITEYITDHSVPPPQAGPLSTATAFYSALSGFYLKVMPQNDQWGTAFNVYCGTAVAGANIGGISSAGDDDFLIQSFGRDKAATTFTFDPASPASAFFSVSSMSDFDQDLVNWNGTWIHAPRSFQQ